jgi:ribonuclease HI
VSKVATVVWLNGLSKQRRAQVLKEVHKATFKVIVVVSHRVCSQFMRRIVEARNWKRMATFSTGSRLMLSANQFDFAPKASSLVLEVWANRVAQLAVARAQQPALSSIELYTMPEEPLKALQDMTGGRWDSFHAESQDFAYRDAVGIVTATDGSVTKDEDGNVRMAGGVAFGEGNHGLADCGVHVRGHISSFVAEGAAALVSLQRTPKDVALTILTDSANIMFAMQHCSRKEQWKDFTDHPEAELISELAKALAAHTAPTVWVKIKSHRSVHLNEKADQLATNAYSDEEAPFFTFNRQELYNVLHIYRISDTDTDTDTEVIVQSAEILDHFI